MQGTQVQSLVRELGSHMLRGQLKQQEQQQQHHLQHSQISHTDTLYSKKKKNSIGK